MRRLNPEVSFAQAYFAFRRDYEEAYARMTRAFPDLKQALKEYPDALAGFTHAGLALINARTLVSIVLHEKQVPSDKAKAFAKAVKVFEKMTRTRNVGAMFVKNLKSLQLLLETDAWLNKGTEPARTFSVGPFHVHNQTRRDDVSVTVKVLEAATDAIRRSRVPRASEILYGDVYLSEEISRKKSEAARYYTEKDTIFLHLLDRFAVHAERALIHEFGHRYWNRFMDPKTKSDWYMYDRRLREVHVEVPKPGDTIVVGVHPDKPDKLARVTDIREGGRGRWFIHVEGGGHFNLDAYLDLARKIARIKQFPTFYASTDHEEHFCEAFSLYCLGELDEPHRSNFEAILRIAPIALATGIPVGTQRSLFNPSRTRRLGARIGGSS